MAQKITKNEMLLREVIDYESTYNQTPEGKYKLKLQIMLF